MHSSFLFAKLRIKVILWQPKKKKKTNVTRENFYVQIKIKCEKFNSRR